VPEGVIEGVEHVSAHVSAGGVVLSREVKLRRLRLDEHAKTGSFHVAVGATDVDDGTRWFLKGYIKEEKAQMRTPAGDVIVAGLMEDLLNDFRQRVLRAGTCLFLVFCLVMLRTGPIEQMVELQVSPSKVFRAFSPIVLKYKDKRTHTPRRWSGSLLTIEAELEPFTHFTATKGDWHSPPQAHSAQERQHFTVRPRPKEFGGAVQNVQCTCETLKHVQVERIVGGEQGVYLTDHQGKPTDDGAMFSDVLAIRRTAAPVCFGSHDCSRGMCGALGLRPWADLTSKDTLVKVFRSHKVVAEFAGRAERGLHVWGHPTKVKHI